MTQQMKTPQTKREALNCEELKMKWGASKKMRLFIVNYLIDIGARTEIPQSDEDLIEFIDRFHRMMTVENFHFPMNIPFNIVYPEFFKAVMNGIVEIREFYSGSIKNQIEAFKKWMLLPNTNDKLQALYSKHYGLKDHELAATEKNTRLEDWEDHTIRSQYAIIMTLQNTSGMFNKKTDAKSDLFKSTDQNSYFNRIRSEFFRRKLSL